MGSLAYQDWQQPSAYVPRIIRVNYNAPPTVASFMDSDAFVRCLVGPVGSGKSSGCNMELLRRSVEQKRGTDGIRRTRWAVIRNTYRELNDTTRRTFEEWVRPELGEWRERDFTFQIRFNDVEADILFRALDRPEDVKKLLSLELTGAYINEGREVRKAILDVLQSRVGRYPSKAQGGPSWFGVWMDSNPFHTGHELYKLFKREKPKGYEIFEQPSGLDEGAENAENLPDGYYERLCHGKDSEWVDEYVRGLYPKRDKGSVYGDLLNELENRGGFTAFEHPRDGIFVNFDLGISDATAMWAWRVNGEGGVDVLAHYEASGKPISHFHDKLEEWEREFQFEYVKLFLPHDARARTLVTGASVQDAFLEKYGNSKVAITPQLSLEDGLQAGRWLLERSTRFHTRTAGGFEALRAYRYEFDEDAKAFGRKPVHDWSSHTADAWRYVGCVVRVAMVLQEKPKPKPQPKARSLGDFTLSEMYAMAKRAPSRRRQ